MDIGDILIRYREENNLSMDDFAKKSGISKAYISLLERKINPRNNKPVAPTLPTLRKIAFGLNMDIDELLKLLDNKQAVSLDAIEKENTETPKIEMGENIKHWRVLRGLTQQEFSEKLGVSDKTISSWELNRTQPKLEIIEKICLTLACKKTDIVGDNSSDKKIDPTTQINIDYLMQNPDFNIIIESLKRVPKDDLETIKNIIEKFSNKNL